MADKLRIMLVDDHYLVRMGLASIIALEPDMTVCAEASTLTSAATRVPQPKRHPPAIQIETLTDSSNLKAFAETRWNMPA